MSSFFTLIISSLSITPVFVSFYNSCYSWIRSFWHCFWSFWHFIYYFLCFFISYYALVVNSVWFANSEAASLIYNFTWLFCYVISIFCSLTNFFAFLSSFFSSLILRAFSFLHCYKSLFIFFNTFFAYFSAFFALSNYCFNVLYEFFYTKLLFRIFSISAADLPFDAANLSFYAFIKALCLSTPRLIIAAYLAANSSAFFILFSAYFTLLKALILILLYFLRDLVSFFYVAINYCLSFKYYASLTICASSGGIWSFSAN